VVELLGRGGFEEVLKATRKLAGGHTYNQEFVALKSVTKQPQENVELKVFCEAAAQPYLVQLVSFFGTVVCSSYLNVSVFR
jgi:hypothetical protein